jgi:uncharacterized RDD family membrane protein YckC
MPGVAWAGVGRRLAALIIDTIVAIGLFILGSEIAVALGLSTTSSDGTPAGYAVAWFTFGVFLLYVPFCWRVWQGTVGQRLLRMRVLRASDGRSLGTGAVILRYFLWLLCVCTIIIAAAAALTVTLSPTRRSWIDDVAGSVVVQRV